MKVKELITALLDTDMDKEVIVEYPTADGHIVGNYSRYDASKNIIVNEYSCAIIIGVPE